MVPVHGIHPLRNHNSLEFKSGATGFKLVVGNRTISIINAKFVPTGEAWGVQNPCGNSTAPNSILPKQIPAVCLPLFPERTITAALLAAYGEFMCQNPGRLVFVSITCGVAAVVRATGITISDATKALTTAHRTAYRCCRSCNLHQHSQVRWYSSDATKATVSATGLVTAIANGSAVNCRSRSRRRLHGTVYRHLLQSRLNR